ncbi:1,4-dihydroxy-2-naphthoate polyprenyltransferase [Pseudactinotalea sp. HY160]|nr:1,4-dihydroxy-2-naphthoate polyprenyltransferase [Pseudactinotalea sp. HY160]
MWVARTPPQVVRTTQSLPPADVGGPDHTTGSPSHPVAPQEPVRPPNGPARGGYAGSVTAPAPAPRPTLADWLEGARLRTLPAAIAPVLAGTGMAGADADALLAALAVIVALALQIGVNFANDYSDGIRGTDSDRVGPTRLTASGLVTPRSVKLLAFAFFALAGAAGVALSLLAGTWYLILVGVVCVIAAWYYTGGRSPYGYRGLGEVAVFVFFGWVATLGTTFTQTLEITWSAFLAGTGMGLIACALLMVNNLRDIATDEVAGKHTLAVRLGVRQARTTYVALVLGGSAVCVGALVATWHWTYLLVVPLGIFALVVSSRVLRGDTGRALVPVLRDTGLLQLGFGIVLGLGAVLA